MLRTLPVRYYVFALIALVAANVLVYRAVFAPYALTVTVLALRESPPTQSNSVLIRTPSRTTILVDTGPDASILRALGAALPPWQRRIDGVVLTSEKKSQAGGLPDVSSRYRVGTILRAGTAILYGEPISLSNGLSLTILAPGTITIASASSTLTISPSTPPGTYPL